MKIIPSWTAAQTKMSVSINGTYVPFKTAPDLMQRFVRPALFSTGDAVFELQVFPSAHIRLLLDGVVDGDR
jgi:hypothetical protein